MNPKHKDFQFAAESLDLAGAKAPKTVALTADTTKDSDNGAQNALNRSIGGNIEVRFPTNGTVEYRAPSSNWLRLPHPRNSNHPGDTPRVLIEPTLRRYGGQEFAYYYAVETTQGTPMARDFLSSTTAGQRAAFEIAAQLGIPAMALFGGRGKFIAGQLGERRCAVLVHVLRADTSGYSFHDIAASIAHESDHARRFTAELTLPLGKGAPLPEITAHLAQRRAYNRMGMQVPEAFSTDANLLESLRQQEYPPEQIQFAENYLRVLRSKEHELGIAPDSDFTIVSHEEMKALAALGRE